MANTFFKLSEVIKNCNEKYKNIKHTYFWFLLVMYTLAVTFMLFNLLAILFKASLKSDWNIKHATRSPKWGISLSSNKNCSGLSSGWSGWEATCSLIKLNSFAVADYAKLQIIYYNYVYIQTRLVSILDFKLTTSYICWSTSTLTTDVSKL